MGKKIKKTINSHAIRYLLMMFSVIMLAILINVIPYLNVGITGKVGGLSEEEIKTLIDLISKMLFGVLTYLVGRGFRYVFEK